MFGFVRQSQQVNLTYVFDKFINVRRLMSLKPIAFESPGFVCAARTVARNIEHAWVVRRALEPLTY